MPSYKQWQEKLEENARLKEQINKCCIDAINRGTANTVKAVKEFGMPERIEELVKQNAQLKKQLMASNNWVKAFYAYEKSNFVRRKVAAHIKEVEKILREQNDE